MISQLKYLFIILFTFVFTNTKSQVVANFSMTPPNGCSPLAVNFSDLSTPAGTITSWQWTLGNGNNATIQNPGAIYNTPGNYGICLTVSDGTTNDTFCDTLFVYGDPIILFEADDTVGCSNLNVQFTNLSITGTGIASALWNFGDGVTSTNINPAHTFGPGCHDITLIVTDSSGCITQGDKICYINPTFPPIVNFSATNNQNCSVPTNVNFTNTSTFDAGSTYFWDFGDGSTSTIENPSHIYNNYGSYDVKLIVNKNGCIDSILKPNFAVFQAQDADFSASATSICEGQSVSFTDLSILTGNSYSWDFGDGGVSSSQNPNHTYTTAGVYTVSMTAFIPTCDDTETKNAFITVNPSPTASFSANQTDTCGGPFTVNFTSVATAGVTYAWSFGDSGTDIVANPTHTYTSNGSFNVSLTVTSVNGCTFTTSSNSFINITPPSANFNIDSTFGCAPKTITFTDISTADNPIVSWEWDFGDGIGTSNIQDPTYIYTDTGSFDISLIIIDASGCTDTVSPGGNINIGQAFNPSFTYTPTTACKLTPIDFTNTTDTLFINEIQWLWNFGDGGISPAFETEYEYGDTGYFEVCLQALHNGCISDTCIDSAVHIFPPIALFNSAFDCSNLFDVEFQDNSIAPETWEWTIDGNTFNTDTTTYTFPDTGTYSVTLIVENLTHGCIDSITQDVTIVNPTVNFSYDDSIGCPPFNVNFTDLSTQATAWAWNFGDGSTSSAQNPSHTYNTPGVYDVQLIITSLNGCKDTLFKAQKINALAITPDFAAIDTSGCRPFNVVFNDASTSLGGNITNWSWNFGDGIGTSTLQNPNYLYTDVGTYSVTLSITDSTGCTGSLTKSTYISTTGPLPSFTNPSTVCIGNNVTFTNTSTTLGGNITNYLWNFGDGNTSALQNPTHVFNQGIYDISLYILDNNGCDTTLSTINTIIVDSLIVDFTADATSSNCPPFIVNFQDLSSPNPQTWFWDLGNGVTSNVQNPSIVYNTVNDIDIQLIVTNSSGCLDTLTQSNFIQIDGPSGTLVSSPDSGCIDLDVLFEVINTNSVQQTWDFGEGTLITNNLFAITHTYTAIDTFYPSVLLTDATGCTFSYNFDSISTGTLNANFSNDLNYVCMPGNVSFTDLSTSIPPITSWMWDFGDGNTSNTQNNSHNYTTHGVYNPFLIINNGLCSDTAYISQSIVSDSSTNSFFTITPPPVVCPPTLVDFTNMSTADSTINTWNWNFGDGQTDVNQNPASVSYTNSGTFLITLDITTIKGCTNHFEDSVTIDPIPTFSFNLDSIDLCINKDTMINSLGDATFTWTPSTNLSCDDCPDPIITANSSETYFVHAVNTFGCVYDDTLFFTMHGTPPMTVTEGELVQEGDLVEMHAFASGISKFYWEPSENLSCNNCADNTFTANETTLFTISIADKYGCANKDTILIEVFDLCDDNSILFPNVFTPNNDKKNDVFKATTLKNLLPEINYYRIFDRWGNLVFETQDIKEAWDGNNKNGKYLNNGVYVYVLDVICPDGSNKLLQGNVTLIR